MTERILKRQNGIWLVNTIQAREKLPNVHVVQWLGMFWLDFGRNIRCLACTLWVKKRKKNVLTWKWFKKLNATLSNPDKSPVNQRGFREGHKPLHLSTQPKISG